MLLFFLFLNLLFVPHTNQAALFYKKFTKSNKTGSLGIISEYFYKAEILPEKHFINNPLMKNSIQ